MERKVIQSSALAEVGYKLEPGNLEFGTLEVLFPSKALWRYYGVPNATYNALMAAQSLGQYFATNIRANFRAERVHDEGCNFGPVSNPMKTYIPCGVGCRCWCHTIVKSSEEKKSHGDFDSKKAAEIQKIKAQVKVRAEKNRIS